MLTIRELRAMRATMSLETFVQQLGPFVLVRKPADAIEAAAAMELAAKGTMLMPRKRSADGVSLLFEFEDLEIATLPPLSVEEVITLGRLPDNDVVIDHTSVSKRHAEVRWKDGRSHVVDLNSTNGTLVNDARVETREELKDSDIVTFGDVRFCFLLTPSLYRFMAKPPTLRRPSGNEPILSTPTAARAAETTGPIPGALLGAALQPTPIRGSPPPPPPASSAPEQSLPQIVHRRPDAGPAQPPPVLMPQATPAGPPMMSAAPAYPKTTDARTATPTPNPIARTSSAERMPRTATPAQNAIARTSRANHLLRTSTPDPAIRSSSSDRNPGGVVKEANEAQPRSSAPSTIPPAGSTQQASDAIAEEPTRRVVRAPASSSEQPRPLLTPPRFSQPLPDAPEPTITALRVPPSESGEEPAEEQSKPTIVRDRRSDREPPTQRGAPILPPEPPTQPGQALRPTKIPEQTIAETPRSKQRRSRKNR